MKTKKLEGLKNEMYTLKSNKTVKGGLQYNATIEWVNGKRKILNDGV